MIIIIRKSLLILLTTLILSFFILELFLWCTGGEEITPISLPVILLDPGHGGVDSGTHDNSGLEEKHITLQYAFLLKTDLEKYGFTVFMTRTDDRELSKLAPYQGTRQRTDLLARARMAAFYNANLLISIHVNAAFNRNLCGAITFYQKKSPQSKKLAGHIQKAIQQVQPYNTQTTLKGSFYLLNVAKIPAVLLELAFITNPREHQLLKDPVFLKTMSSQTALGIYNYTLQESKSTFLHKYFHKKRY